MLKRSLSCSLILVLLVSLQACASLQRKFAKEPEAKLKELRLESVGLSGVELALDVEVYNPNRYALKLLELNYQVHAMGTLLGEGAYQEEVEFPGRASRVVTVPFKVRTRAALGLAQHFLAANGQVEAKLQGDIRLGTPVGTWQVPFDENKSIKNPLKE